MWDSNFQTRKRSNITWKIIENHGHNDYGIFWQFYGEIIFK